MVAMRQLSRQQSGKQSGLGSALCACLAVPRWWGSQAAKIQEPYECFLCMEDCDSGCTQCSCTWHNKCVRKWGQCPQCGAPIRTAMRLLKG